MAEDGLLQEVVDDVRTELRRRRLQVLAAVAYLVLAAGGLYLFSSIGEDSGDLADVHRRTTLAAVGTGLLAGGVLLCVATLVLDGVDRRRVTPGREPGARPDRRRLALATAGGTAAVAAGLLALSRWS